MLLQGERDNFGLEEALQVHRVCAGCFLQNDGNSSGVVICNSCITNHAMSLRIRPTVVRSYSIRFNLTVQDIFAEKLRNSESRSIRHAFISVSNSCSKPSSSKTYERAAVKRYALDLCVQNLASFPGNKRVYEGSGWNGSP